MRMSEEAEAAYAELDKAIERVRRAADPGIQTVLGDWALIAVEYNIEEPSRATYSRMFRGGALPYHVAVGLLETALELTQEEGAGDEE